MANATTSAPTTSPLVIGTLPVGGLVAVSPDGSHLYVVDIDNLNGPRVWVIDAATNTVIGTPISVPGGGIYPGAVALSPDGSRLYIANTSGPGLAVLNTITKTEISAPVVGGSDDLAVSPDGSRIYVAATDYTGSHPLSVVDSATNTIIGSPISVGTSVGTKLSDLAVSPDGSRVYAIYNTYYGSEADQGRVSVINTATNAAIGTPIPVGWQPLAVAVSPDGHRVYVANMNGTMSVIDTSTNTVVDTFLFGKSVNDTEIQDLAVSPDGSRIYAVGGSTNAVDNNAMGTVSVIDTATDTVVGTPIPVSGPPFRAVISPDGSRLYVTGINNTGAMTVSIIDTGVLGVGGGTSGALSNLTNALNQTAANLKNRVLNSSGNPVDNFLINPQTGLWARAASLGEDALSVIGGVGEGAASVVARLNPLVSLGLGVTETVQGTQEIEQGHAVAGVLDYSAGALSVLTVVAEADPATLPLVPVLAVSAATLEGVNAFGHNIFHWW
jgi:YVTN family beta-propeller protein